MELSGPAVSSPATAVAAAVVVAVTAYDSAVAVVVHFVEAVQCRGIRTAFAHFASFNCIRQNWAKALLQTNFKSMLYYLIRVYVPF